MIWEIYDIYMYLSIYLILYDIKYRVCIYIYIYTYISIRVHTYIHTYTQAWKVIANLTQMATESCRRDGSVHLKLTWVGIEKPTAVAAVRCVRSRLPLKAVVQGCPSYTCQHIPSRSSIDTHAPGQSPTQRRVWQLSTSS